MHGLGLASVEEFLNSIEDVTDPNIAPGSSLSFLSLSLTAFD